MTGNYSLSLPLPIMPGTSVPGVAQMVDDILADGLSESSGSNTVSGNERTYSEILEQVTQESNTVSGNESTYSETPEQVTQESNTVSGSDPYIESEIETSQLIQLVNEQNNILQNGFTAISIMLGLIFGAIAIKGFWIARVKE